MNLVSTVYSSSKISVIFVVYAPSSGEKECLPAHPKISPCGWKYLVDKNDNHKKIFLS